MKLMLISLLCLTFAVSACVAAPTITQIEHKYNLKDGVKEPTYPPDGNINCWVQPAGADLWYPCPEPEDILQRAH
jgi:hypothetical protein